MPLASHPTRAETPAAQGFRHYAKCAADRDVTRLGDTGTAAACLAVCRAVPGAAGCWWLDGNTGPFPRECRVCRTRAPVWSPWPNDWALPFATPTVSAAKSAGDG